MRRNFQNNYFKNEKELSKQFNYYLIKRFLDLGNDDNYAFPIPQYKQNVLLLDL